MGPSPNSDATGHQQDTATTDRPTALCLRGYPALVEELRSELKHAEVPVRTTARMRALGDYSEVLVTLASAGAFTALYEIIGRVVLRHKGRELSIERNGFSVSLKGHGLTEEKELLRQLAPELLRPTAQRKKPPSG